MVQRTGQQNIVGMHVQPAFDAGNSGNYSGIMYHNTHIDDNLHLKTNVNYSQIGFLPSILKSFQ